MVNVVKKHSISSELAQKMVDEAVAKARKIGVTENVAILDDGGNLKAFTRMDGAPILSIEIAQNKAYTALFGFAELRKLILKLSDKMLSRSACANLPMRGSSPTQSLTETKPKSMPWQRGPSHCRAF